MIAALAEQKIKNETHLTKIKKSSDDSLHRRHLGQKNPTQICEKNSGTGCREIRIICLGTKKNPFNFSSEAVKFGHRNNFGSDNGSAVVKVFPELKATERPLIEIASKKIKIEEIKILS